MRRVLWIAAAGVLLFAALLVARFPARWAAGWLPEGVQCARLGGTVWSGRCAGLTVGANTFDAARWDLRPARLLTGVLAADVIVTRGALDARGAVERERSGRLVMRDLRAVIPLDPAVLAQLPRTLRGTVNAELATLALRGRVIEQIEGRLEGRDLVQGQGPRATRLGDYAVTFPPTPEGGEPVGSLQDLGGPLDVTGQLRLTREPGYVLEGAVAARADASPELARQLQYLGRPDAAGRRPFSIAGTF